MPWNDYPLRSITVPADHAPGDAYIFIGDDDPVAQALGENAAIVFHFGTHNSAFTLGITDSSIGSDDVGGLSLTATSDQSGSVTPVLDFIYDPNNIGDTSDMTFSQVSAFNRTQYYGGTVALRGYTDVTVSSDNGDLELNTSAAKNINANGNPLGWGWVAGASVTASRPALVAAGEVVQLTALTAAGANPTFQPGRSYRVVVSVQTQTSAVGSAPLLGVRKTNAAGQRLTWNRFGPTVAGFPYASYWESYFQVGATAVTAPIVLTLGGVAGQTLQVVAAADSVASFDIYDDGPASIHPNAPVLV